jgi:hypothetical protein
VTTVTSALVAAGDLGSTLDRERWRRRAADLGIVERTDRVVLACHPRSAAEPGYRAHQGLVLDVLAHLTGEVTAWEADWVVHAGPPAPHVPVLDVDVPVLRVGDCVAPRDLAAAVREGSAAGESLCE